MRDEEKRVIDVNQGCPLVHPLNSRPKNYQIFQTFILFSNLELIDQMD